MRKRFFRKAVLAAVIAVPAVFSHPDSGHCPGRGQSHRKGERSRRSRGAGSVEL